MMPPRTPPAEPPAIPPGTPPTTPTLPMSGGSSSSLIIATFFGITVGAIIWPLLNQARYGLDDSLHGRRGRRRRWRRSGSDKERGEHPLGQRFRVDQRNQNHDAHDSDLDDGGENHGPRACSSASDCADDTTRSSNIWLPPCGCRHALFGCGSGANGGSLTPIFVPNNHDGCCNTETGVRSYHNSHHHGKRESAKNLAAHDSTVPERSERSVRWSESCARSV